MICFSISLYVIIMSMSCGLLIMKLISYKFSRFKEQQMWTGWSEFKINLPIRKLKTLQVAETTRYQQIQRTWDQIPCACKNRGLEKKQNTYGELLHYITKYFIFLQLIKPLSSKNNEPICTWNCPHHSRLSWHDQGGDKVQATVKGRWCQ